MNRRSFITNLVSFVATAPAIVCYENIMPVRSFVNWPQPGDKIISECSKFYICIASGVSGGDVNKIVESKIIKDGTVEWSLLGEPFSDPPTLKTKSLQDEAI